MENALLLFPNSTNEEHLEKLQASLGLERTQEIINELIRHTSTEAARVKADRYVFFQDEIPDNNSNWPEADFIYELQAGNSFGERLSLAFESLFRIGYKKVIYIPDNYPELTFDLISKAFDLLNETDTVIGPSKYGDYYLLGLKHYAPELFNNKIWNSPTIFDATINDFIHSGLIWHELPILSRINSADDIHLAGIKKFYRKIVDQVLFVN
jgi:glycosyltransferase A (GT-A) superfamily protein (DUF2064 family)